MTVKKAKVGDRLQLDIQLVQNIVKYIPEKMCTYQVYMKKLIQLPELVSTGAMIKTGTIDVEVISIYWNDIFIITCEPMQINAHDNNTINDVVKKFQKEGWEITDQEV